MGANVSFYYACGNSETDKIAHKLLNEWEGLLRLHPIVNDSYFIPKKTRYISQNHIQLLRIKYITILTGRKYYVDNNTKHY